MEPTNPLIATNPLTNESPSKSHGDDFNDEFFTVRSPHEKLETLCQARTLAHIKFGKVDYLYHDGAV